MKTNDEIFKELLELAEDTEQVQYLTRENDGIKDGKIAALQNDIGQIQRALERETNARLAAENITMKIVESLIKKAINYDGCC